MLKVLIVDDEPLARENLRILLETQPDIEIVGECGNAVEAIGAVHKLRPDVLFLDIQMPRISGLEMVGMLDPEHRPYIVFLTAFDEYAVKAFEEHAFDYLLKPIEPPGWKKRCPPAPGAQPAGYDRARRYPAGAESIFPAPDTAGSGCCRWRMWPLSAAG
jgi:DNA-binding LytR/AlgR family response regulator